MGLRLSPDELHDLEARMLRARRRYDPARGPFGPYIDMAKRHALREIRRQRRRERQRSWRTEPLDDLLGTDREPHATPDFLERLELTDAIGWLLQRATPREREVMRLLLAADLDRNEAAKAMGRTLSAINGDYWNAVLRWRHRGRPD